MSSYCGMLEFKCCCGDSWSPCLALTAAALLPLLLISVAGAATDNRVSRSASWLASASDALPAASAALALHVFFRARFHHPM
jgi:hypothetical protein